jgi:hypothetical protein
MIKKRKIDLSPDISDSEGFDFVAFGNGTPSTCKSLVKNASQYEIKGSTKKINKMTIDEKIEKMVSLDTRIYEKADTINEGSYCDSITFKDEGRLDEETAKNIANNIAKA